MNPSILITPNAKKAGKLYSIIPTDGAGDLDVVRNTTATYVDADGLIKTALANEPRFDYSNGSCPSILVEPQRTNLLLYSNAFDNSYWGKANIITTGTPTWINVSQSPDGNVNSYKLIPNTSTNSGHFVSKITTLSAGTYTYSMFVKDDGYRFCSLSSVLAIQDWVRVVFDLQTGTITQITQGTSSTYTNLTGNIEEFSDGWYRCSITFTSSLSNFSIQTNVSNSGTPTLNSSFGLVFFVGDEINGILIYGAQLEAGSNATSYIPTTTTSVTRNADVISKSGISDLIGQTEGSVYFEIDFNVISNAGFRNFFSLEGDIPNQFSGLYISTSNNANNIYYAGTSYNLTQGVHKIVCSYNKTTNTSKLYVDGVLRATSTTFSGFASTITRVSLGSRINPFASFVTDRYQDGSFNSFMLFPTELTNTQAIQLTTL